MMPVAGTRPSKSEPVSRNMSAQCGEMRCRRSRRCEMALGTRIGHDLRRLQFGLLFEHNRQQNRTVTQSA